MGRSKLLVLVAVATWLASSVLSSTVAKAEPFPPVVPHTAIASAAGFLGCLEYGSSGEVVCVAAQTHTDGVQLSVFERDGVEHGFDPSGSITRSEDLSIHIRASLPLSGSVDLTSIGGQATGEINCALCGAPSYHLRSDAAGPTLNRGTTDFGTIAGRSVASSGHYWHRNNANYWGATSGWYAGPAIAIYRG